MNKSKILGRLKKLLELSNSKSYNPNEAAAALKRANVLMQKYGIKKEDIVLSNIEEKEVRAFRGEQPSSYLSYLALSISEMFGCDYIYTWDYESYQSKTKWRFRVHGNISFVGFSPNQEVAAYCFEVILKRMLSARKNFLRELRQKGEKDRVSKADKYAEGWAVAIHKKVKHLIPPIENIDNDENVLLIHKTAIQKYIDSQTKRVTKPKESSAKMGYLTRGFIDGNKEEINKPLNTNISGLIE